MDPKAGAVRSVTEILSHLSYTTQKRSHCYANEVFRYSSKSRITTGSKVSTRAGAIHETHLDMNMSSDLPINCCTSCAFGRRDDRTCDIHGTEVSKQLICRSYRQAYETHTQARARVPFLRKLDPGVVYSIRQQADESNFIHASYKTTQLNRNEPAAAFGDTIFESYEISVKTIDGSIQPARIEGFDSGLMKLTMSDVRYAVGPAGNAFHTLMDMRREMEIDGRIPLVNGANRHALITGMAISMADGYRVYLISDSADGCNDIVDTFGNDRVTDPVYVHEQELFCEEYWKKNSV